MTQKRIRRDGRGMRHEWGKRNASRVLVGKRELRTPHGKRKGIREDNETDFRETGLQGVH